jgi:hypothetical protein
LSCFAFLLLVKDAVNDRRGRSSSESPQSKKEESASLLADEEDGRLWATDEAVGKVDIDGTGVGANDTVGNRVVATTVSSQPEDGNVVPTGLAGVDVLGFTSADACLLSLDNKARGLRALDGESCSITSALACGESSALKADGELEILEGIRFFGDDRMPLEIA